MGTRKPKSSSRVWIRPYRAGDLAACRALWAELTQAHRDIYADPSIGGAAPGRYFDRHLARAGAKRLWVAQTDGKVVGLTGLLLADGEIEPVVVTAEWRGRGIGRLLVKRAVAEARKLRVRFLSVRPVARNSAALRFFHRLGFCILGHVDMFQDLRPSRRGYWKRGARLFGLPMAY